MGDIKFCFADISRPCAHTNTILHVFEGGREFLVQLIVEIESFIDITNSSRYIMHTNVIHF